jgi:hypothetical protein
MAELTLPDFSEIETENLKDMILRHEKQGVTNTPRYRAAVEEVAKRQSKNLNPDVTLKHLMDCAKKSEYTTYKRVAEANGADWGKIHWQIAPHLDSILQICHARELPLFTAICVTEPEIKTGNLEGSSLAGFIKGVKRLRYSVVDEQQFLKEAQKACFEWPS